MRTASDWHPAPGTRPARTTPMPAPGPTGDDDPDPRSSRIETVVEYAIMAGLLALLVVLYMAIDTLSRLPSL